MKKSEFNLLNKEQLIDVETDIEELIIKLIERHNKLEAFIESIVEDSSIRDQTKIVPKSIQVLKYDPE